MKSQCIIHVELEINVPSHNYRDNTCIPEELIDELVKAKVTKQLQYGTKKNDVNFLLRGGISKPYRFSSGRMRGNSLQDKSFIFISKGKLWAKIIQICLGILYLGKNFKLSSSNYNVEYLEQCRLRIFRIRLSFKRCY